MWSIAGARRSQPGCCRRRTYRRPGVGTIMQQAIDVESLSGHVQAHELAQEQEQEQTLEQEQEQD
eukprot:3297770-Alexandrium_andersonii.AAC.1